MCYATSSCSIRTKNRAKQIAGNINVTTGVKIDGKNDAVICNLTLKFILFNNNYITTLPIYCFKTEMGKKWVSYKYLVLQLATFVCKMYSKVVRV